MSKKKTASKSTPRKTVKTAPKAATKADRARAGAAASPVRPADVLRPTAPPAAGKASVAPKPAAGKPSSPGGRLPFRPVQTFNFAGVGRNDICPCGSGKRFKNCHGR